MKTIHIETHSERQLKRGKTHTVSMHYIYLCEGGKKVYLCKQRWHRGVERHFRNGMPVETIRRHRWNRDKMVDHLMDKLPKYLDYAERYGDEYIE